MDIEFDTERYTKEQKSLFYEILDYTRALDIGEVLENDEEGEWNGITQEEFEEACDVYRKWRDNTENENWHEDACEALDFSCKKQGKAM